MYNIDNIYIEREREREGRAREAILTLYIPTESVPDHTDPHLERLRELKKHSPRTIFWEDVADKSSTHIPHYDRSYHNNTT